MTFPNLSGRGDEISMSAISAPDTSDLLYGNLTYMTPIDGKGRQIKAYVSGGRYEVGKEFDVLDIKGDGFSYGIGVTHPQVLSRSKSLTYDLWYEFKDSEHEMLGQTSSKDKISKVRLGASLDQKDRKGRSFVNFKVHQGLGDSLNGMPDKSTLSSRSFALADNRFTKYSLDFTRVEGVNPHIFHIARLTSRLSRRLSSRIRRSEPAMCSGAGSQPGDMMSRPPSGRSQVVDSCQLMSSTTPILV